MYSMEQKKQIAEAVEKVLLSFNHPEMPKEKPEFHLHVKGKESWSFADIQPNWHFEDKAPQVNPWNENNSSPKPIEKIDESMGIHNEWYKIARSQEMNLDTLPFFLKKLTEDYEHNYGTICHAIAAAGIAAMTAVDRSDQGGITGFQASAVAWEIMDKWGGFKPPSRIIQYRDMLFPQYEEKFTKQVISNETFNFLKKEAQEIWMMTRKQRKVVLGFLLK